MADATDSAANGQANGTAPPQAETAAAPPAAPPPASSAPPPASDPPPAAADVPVDDGDLDLQPPKPDASLTPEQQAARQRAYEDRVARAKERKVNLDLSNMALEETMPQGEHELKKNEFMTTSRARTDVAITVRGLPKHRHNKLFVLGPAVLGESKVKFAWRRGGSMLATASIKGGSLVLQLFNRQGAQLQFHTLGTGPPTWLQWDFKGNTLGVMQQGVGIFLWSMAKDEPPTAAPMHLCPSITVNASFCRWSKVGPQLAIGTQQGKVIIFNSQQGVMQLHGKKGMHGSSPVTCGDWLFDNRLGLGSGQRVKISQPMAEAAAEWESYSKFKLSGMMSKVPSHIKGAGAPSVLKFSLGYPPFVAIVIGDKYMLMFDTTRSQEDVGLTFPDDYGGLTGFLWLPNNILLVALANGYITTVDFGGLLAMRANSGLPGSVNATETTKVFNEYLADLTCSEDNSKIAVCGDTGVKIVQRKGMELEVTMEVDSDHKLTIGHHLDCVQFDCEGKAFSCSATNGFLYSYSIQ